MNYGKEKDEYHKPKKTKTSSTPTTVSTERSPSNPIAYSDGVENDTTTLTRLHLVGSGPIGKTMVQIEEDRGLAVATAVSGNSSNYSTSISSCTSSLSPPVKLNNYNTISHSNTTNVVQSNIRSSGNSLVDELKSWRSRVARETNRAPFMIFSEETLNEIVNTMPRTSRELLAIKGIGQVKVDDFGADVLSTTKTHCIYTKYTTTAVASSTKQKANQQCQRCRMDIPTDPDKPLCYGCYRTLTKGSK